MFDPSKDSVSYSLLLSPLETKAKGLELDRHVEAASKLKQVVWESLCAGDRRHRAGKAGTSTDGKAHATSDYLGIVSSCCGHGFVMGAVPMMTAEPFWLAALLLNLVFVRVKGVDCVFYDVMCKIRGYLESYWPTLWQRIRFAGRLFLFVFVLIDFLTVIVRSSWCMA